MWLLTSVVSNPVTIALADLAERLAQALKVLADPRVGAGRQIAAIAEVYELPRESVEAAVRYELLRVAS